MTVLCIKWPKYWNFSFGGLGRGSRWYVGERRLLNCAKNFTRFQPWSLCSLGGWGGGGMMLESSLGSAAFMEHPWWVKQG